MKTFPFYRNEYYVGKLSYSKIHKFYKSPFKHMRFDEITRMSQPWLVKQGYRFIVHISYSGLIYKSTNRKKLKCRTK